MHAHSNTTRPTVIDRYQRAIRASFLFCLPLACLILVMITRTQNRSQQTLLMHWSQSSFFEKLRSDCISNRERDQKMFELKKNFLANEKIQDSNLIEDFRASGLAHLLALSGGQTAPAANVIGTTIVFLILLPLKLRPQKNTLGALNFIRTLSFLVQSTVLAFLLGLYQSTGALSRTLAAHFTFGARAAAIHSHSKYSENSIWLPSLCLALPWYLSWIWHRNPVADLSFLLSALGASTAVFVIRTLNLLYETSSIESSSGAAFSNLISQSSKHPWVESTLRWIISTAFTSCAMSMLTWPLWPPGSVNDKILANLLAGPCVLFIITPGSLIVCLGTLTSLSFVSTTGHDILKLGLEILLAIAGAFSSPQETNSNIHHTWNNQNSLLILNSEILILIFLGETLRRLHKD